MSKKKWRQSDQVNSELPVGRTWIDDDGQLKELKVQPLLNGTGWIAFIQNEPGAVVSGNGPDDVVKNWDRRVSSERQIRAAFESDSKDYF